MVENRDGDEMSRKQPNTPRSRVRQTLRQLFLRSRERAAALKQAGYCCQVCGIKQSKAKGREVRVEVHHADGIAWERLIDQVYESLLCHPSKMRVLCEEHHKQEHEEATP